MNRKGIKSWKDGGDEKKRKRILSLDYFLIMSWAFYLEHLVLLSGLGGFAASMYFRHK